MPFNDDSALDEQLDALDPLRHLMQQSQDIDSIDESSKTLSVLPQQTRSVQDEIHRFSFINDRDTSQPTIAITLSVDASPGCGGVAWPAGQVSTSTCPS